jgi:hypothetical protein
MDYLQVTDEHWLRASESESKGQATDQTDPALWSVLQNPVQSVAGLAGTGSYENAEIPGKNVISRG